VTRDDGESPFTPWFSEVADVNCTVEQEDGEFVVYFNCITANGGIRRRIGAWRTRSRAEQAARVLKRNATRHRSPPPDE